MSKLYVTIGGYAVAALMGWLLLGAKQDLGEAIEQCNSQKLEAIAEATRLAGNAQREALERRLAELEGMALDADEARRIADMARSEAEDRAIGAQETIRIMTREAQNDETAPIEQRCLTVAIPDVLLDGLRP